jgi:hypothetical protein
VVDGDETPFGIPGWDDVIRFALAHSTADRWATWPARDATRPEHAITLSANGHRLDGAVTVGDVAWALLVGPIDLGTQNDAQQHWMTEGIVTPCGLLRGITLGPGSHQRSRRCDDQARRRRRAAGPARSRHPHRRFVGQLMQFIIQILAMFWAPIVAVEVTRRLNNRKEVRARRQQLFNTLMTTSGDFGSLGRLSHEHVRALNLIEIEFYGDKYKAVIEAWREYLACLNSPPTEKWTPENTEGWDQWNKRRDELLVKLLYDGARTRL